MQITYHRFVEIKMVAHSGRFCNRFVLMLVYEPGPHDLQNLSTRSVQIKQRDQDLRFLWVKKPLAFAVCLELTSKLF